MKIKKLSLNDFRNYENETIEFSSGINIIYGNNGMGKTNALEAIYYFSQGRGFRGGNKEVIRTCCEEACTEMVFEAEDREFKGVIRFNGKQKKITVNDIELKKTSQLIGKFVCVLFTPDELNLVKGFPDIRRRFMDVSIIPMKPSYLSSLMTYNLILKQKSSLLRNEKYDMLPIFNSQLAEIGSKIIMMRQSYIEKIKKAAKDVQFEISGGSENLEISYNPSVKFGGGLEKTRENFLEKLNSMEESEKENKICFVGPHRDDLSFKINDKNARNFASQGQQRSVVLAMKVAQMELINEEMGEYPVLLLDDIMSELDKNRRSFLTEKIVGKQVILTCTDLEKSDVNKFNKAICVENGKIRAVREL